MSTKASKNELIEAWSQEVQKTGTLTVLHTNAVAQHIGLSATEFEAVDVISRNQPMTAGGLSVACGLTTGAITGLVDRLERERCIKRTGDPEDRRKVLLVPVRDSRKSKKITKLYQPIAEGFSALAAKYSKEELVFLIKVQSEMNQMAEDAIRRVRDGA